MLNYNSSPEKESIPIKSPNSNSNSKSKILITYFLPRQLLINSYNSNRNSINMNPNNQNQNRDSDNQRDLILNSISQFLDINGFSKSLKYFRKEANLQKDDGGSCLLNFEEMCFKYFKSRNGAKEELASNQKCVESAKDCGITNEHIDNEGKRSNLPTETDAVEVTDVKSKKKKKKSKSADCASELVVEETLLKPGENEEEKSELQTESGNVDGDNVKSKKKKKKNKSDNSASEQVIEETQSKAEENEKKISIVDGNDAKSKKKKKNKTNNGASEQVIEDTKSKPAVNSEGITSSIPSEGGKKSKDKKKKLKEESEHLDKDLPEKESIVATTENTNKKEKKVKKEKKGSKIMEENVTDSTAPSTVNIEAGEKKESKKRKKPSSGDDHVEKTVSDDSKRRKTDNSDQSNGKVQPPKTPDVTSAEPTSAKAFQRVKPEDVEFADERLQDNSYWAKDGADSGYGAKAQEVLGQVRGRDFRHEKTKKKRGSYRGGQIDLHTHSVKFNYENED